MAMAADAGTATGAVAAIDPEVKVYTVDIEITSADETTLEGSPNTNGIVTFNTPVYLAGIAGGPWFITLSKEVPFNP